MNLFCIATFILCLILVACEKNISAIPKALIVDQVAIANASFGTRFLLQAQACAPGYGSLPGGGPLCALCPPGYFSRGGVGSRCLVCDQFSYAVSSGSASCTMCPSNQWVGFKGSASPICLCKKNFYLTFFREASLSRQPPPTETEIMLTLSTFSSPSENLCLPCPEGANCLGSLQAPSPRIGKVCLARFSHASDDMLVLQVFGPTNQTLSASSFAHGIKKHVWETSLVFPSTRAHCAANASKIHSCALANVRSVLSPLASLFCTSYCLAFSAASYFYGW